MHYNLPCQVGSLSSSKEKEFGRLLAPYLDQEGTVFVVSSDFCHWGSRFSYEYYDKRHGEIWQSIEALDRLGMASIESQDPKAFAAYQKEYRNTICGRHPIGVLLQALKASAHKHDLQFLSYAQSSKCKKRGDSSVSYASAVVTLS